MMIPFSSLSLATNPSRSAFGTAGPIAGWSQQRTVMYAT